MTVWKRDQEKAEVRERGYLSILQDRAPSQTFREEQGAFKAQGEPRAAAAPGKAWQGGDRGQEGGGGGW